MDRETLKHAATVRQMSANGLSQREIAKAVGISTSTVNRLLNSTDTIEGNALTEMIKRNDERRRQRYAMNDA